MKKDVFVDKQTWAIRYGWRFWTIFNENKIDGAIACWIQRRWH